MTTVSERLADSARRYAGAVQDRGLAMEDLKAAIRAADADGMPRQQIAAVAGVSRQTVYDAIKGDQS